MPNELATLEDAMFAAKGKNIVKQSSNLEDVMFAGKPTKPKLSLGRSLFSPALASKALGVPAAMTAGEQFRKMYSVGGRGDIDMPYAARFGNELATGVAGDVLDIALTPANYLAGPALKAVGKFGGMATRAAQSGARGTAINIARNILKPTGKFAKRGERIAESALEQGVLRSSVKRTAEKAQSRIDALMDQVDELANKAQGSANLKGAYRRVAAAAKYWMLQGKPERAEKILTEITNISKAKMLHPKRQMSIKGILNLRRSQDEALKRLKPGGGFYSETIPADIEARQEFAGGLRKILGQAVPEIGEKNRAISSLIDVKNVAGKRGGVSSRNEPLSLSDLGLLGVGAISPKAWAILAAKKLYQGGKAGVARGLYGFSKIGQRATPKVSRFGSREIPIQQLLESPSAQGLLEGPSSVKGLEVSPRFGQGFERTATTPEDVFAGRAFHGPKQLEDLRQLIIPGPEQPKAFESLLARYFKGPLKEKPRTKQNLFTAAELAMKKTKGKR